MMMEWSEYPDRPWGGVPEDGNLHRERRFYDRRSEGELGQAEIRSGMDLPRVYDEGIKNGDAGIELSWYRRFFLR